MVGDARVCCRLRRGATPFYTVPPHRRYEVARASRITLVPSGLKALSRSGVWGNSPDSKASLLPHILHTNARFIARHLLLSEQGGRHDVPE